MAQVNGTDPACKNLDVDVVIVGGGLSGIASLYRARQQGLRAVILESGTDFGGVWYHNRYPGARVDSEWPYYQLNIPEVYKTFFFTERFPGHVELRRYMAHVDKTLDLRKDTVFEALVNDCSWNEESGKWTLKTAQGHVATSKYLVLASGLLHRRHYPDFAGLENFQGEVHHSGFWPKELTTKGKRVALIGAGATAVQITQEVAKDAEQLTIFMRRPSYCIPMCQRKLSENENYGTQAYYGALFAAARQSRIGFPASPPPTRAISEDNDEEFEAQMSDAWKRGGFQSLGAYKDLFLDKEGNKKVYDFWRRSVSARMRPGKKRDLMAPMEMPYHFATKRTPLEQDYYEMVDKDSVDVVDMNTQRIKSFTTTGLAYEDGSTLDFDILIFATGFDSFSGSVSKMGLKNTQGVDIKNVWEDGIKSYMGMTFEGFPNCFMIYSPHAPTSLSNGPTIIESQADLIFSLISTLQSTNAKSITPTVEAQEQWIQLVEQIASNTLFPLTNSWWTGGNIPGKKVQSLTYYLGVGTYHETCKENFENLRGFDVVYLDGKEQISREMDGSASVAAV